MPKMPLALSFNDVLLKPQFSSISTRSAISLKTYLTSTFQIDLPLVAINMDCVTGVEMAIAMSRLGGVAFYPRFAPVDVQVAEIKQILAAGARVIPAVGIKQSELTRVDALVSLGINTITIDVAHAHLQLCLDFLKTIKQKYPKLEVIAGVVGTYEGARDLFLAGADAVRVGIGPGTICTTRITTGCGVPQITALLDCFKAAKEFSKPIIADGGTKNSGDIVKALAAGGQAVVLGSQLAGAEESAGKIVEMNGKKYKTYNASTSKTEKQNQYQKNPTDKNQDYTDYVEGLESFVFFAGPLSEVLNRLEKGIRSGLSYCGAANIEELHQKARFIRVTSSVAYENQNRGVILI